jgi:Family of unknown function (DUF5681)
MTFRKGKSGNPLGSKIGPKAEKAFAEAVRIVSKRVDSQDKKTLLMKMADRLFDHALKDGESWAFQMIADRLDGKPVQQTEVSINDTRDRIEQFSDDELTLLMRDKIAADAADGADAKSKPPRADKDGNSIN